MSRLVGAPQEPESGAEGGRFLRFDGFEFDLETLVLTRDGRTVRLQPQPSRVLAQLIKARGAVVTREQLRDSIWGGRFVEFDQGLNFCIRQIRSVLADEAETPSFIETLPRRGYRFLARIEDVSPGAGKGGQPGASPSRARWAAGAIAALLALAGLAVWVAGRLGTPATLDLPAGPDEAAAARLSPEARVDFLAALRSLRSRTRDGYRRAVTGFDAVLARHREFLPARVGRAEAWLWEGRTDDARRELDAILRDSPNEGRSHTLRGALGLFRDWDLEASGRHLPRGAELTPSSSIARHYLAYHQLIVGDTGGARRSIERALELDPLSPTLHGDAGLVYYWLRDHVRGGELCRRSGELGPLTRQATSCLFLNEAAAGRRDGMVAAARRLAALDSAPPAVAAALAQGPGGLDRYLDWEIERLSALPDAGQGTALALARAHLLRGRPEEAKAALAAGLGRHSNSLIFLVIEPLLDPIRGDTLVRRIERAVTGVGGQRNFSGSGAAME